MVTYQSKKLASKFPVKDKIDFQHQNNAVYYGKGPNPNCKDDYIGETDRRVIERAINQNKRDKKSHILKHSQISYIATFGNMTSNCLVQIINQILNRKLVSLIHKTIKTFSKQTR